jgi:hypothetical protein
VSRKKGLVIIGAVLLVFAVLAVPFVENYKQQQTIAANKQAAAKKAVVAAGMVGQCKLSVPVDIFNHLETPWQLLPPCHEADPNTNVFVQAVIFNTDTGALSTYSPLVIDAVSAPAVVPVAPTLPAHRVIGIAIGGNDVTTTLVGASQQCVNGAAGRAFGQMAFCGMRGLFDAINNTWVPHTTLSVDKYGNVVSSMNLAPIHIPWIGNETDGQRCPTVRDFRVVDQDQSDNVQTTYLSVAGGQTAQNTAANRAVLAGAVVAKNGSDNRLVSLLVDPAVGCKSWKIPDLADNGNPVPTLVTDELQAAAYQATPIALIPSGDPMTGPNILSMVNAYRLNVDQPRVATLADAPDATYCENMTESAPPWINYYKVAFSASVSPIAGTNLYDFMLARYAASLVLLGCK